MNKDVESINEIINGYLGKTFYNLAKNQSYKTFIEVHKPLENLFPLHEFMEKIKVSMGEYLIIDKELSSLTGVLHFTIDRKYYEEIEQGINEYMDKKDVN